MKYFSGAPACATVSLARYAYVGSEAYFTKTSYFIIALAPVAVWRRLLALCMLVPAPWFWTVYLIQIGKTRGRGRRLLCGMAFRRNATDILVWDAEDYDGFAVRGRKSGHIHDAAEASKSFRRFLWQGLDFYLLQV